MSHSTHELCTLLERIASPLLYNTTGKTGITATLKVIADMQADARQALSLLSHPALAADVGEDERVAFEKWLKDSGHYSSDECEPPYSHWDTHHSWLAWQARATLQLTNALLTPMPIRWQSIENAPKDGTDILLHAPSAGDLPARITIGHWATEKECRVDAGDCGGDCHCREYDYIDPWWVTWDGGFTTEHPPYHWMPLPTAPKPQQGES